ncbi:MAG TPA: DUF3343 domain-containing protein [Gelria sp.]|nr:DUF3343 domain-containing protein [Gelria sp.]
MASELFHTDSYCVFTFAATSHALKAEKVLKKLEADFLVIPTLREISTSCGLSVKLNPANLDRYFTDLINNRVAVEGIYQVKKEGKKNRIRKLELS